MRTAFLSAFCCFLLAAVAACESDAVSKNVAESKAIESVIGTWTLDSIGDKGFMQLVPQDAPVKKPTLDISADGSVSGFAGVNRLMSKIDLDALSKGDFKLSPTGTTMMAGPEYAMKLEREYLDALWRVRNFKIDGSKLTLTDGATQIMQFVRGGS
ncbi:MAG: META domain-containing protein [Phycisphaeraceae bacterium]|nr:META domain-containing protein [Phycisphaeraceae bacterium]